MYESRLATSSIGTSRACDCFNEIDYAIKKVRGLLNEEGEDVTAQSLLQKAKDLFILVEDVEPEWLLQLSQELRQVPKGTLLTKDGKCNTQIHKQLLEVIEDYAGREDSGMFYETLDLLREELATVAMKYARIGCKSNE